MGYRWILPGVFCILLMGTIPTLAAKDELNVLVLGQYQGQFETVMVNMYSFGSYSSQIISIHPGSVFLDGALTIRTETIHHSLQKRGIEPVQKALSEYLKMEIPNYLIVDYEGAQAVVDAMGGVSFDLPYEIQLAATETEEALNLKSGMQLFDGRTARRFLRYRSNNLNGPEELKVIELQQLFLNTMIQQMAREKWKIIPVALKLPKMIKTNLGVRRFLDLAVDAINLDPDNLEVNFGIIPGKFTQVNGDYQYQIQGMKGFRVVQN